MALVAGIQAPPGRIMGHAGAFVGAGEKNAVSKIRALEDAGVIITNHPSKFGDDMKKLLAKDSPQNPPASVIERVIRPLADECRNRPQIPAFTIKDAFTILYGGQFLLQKGHSKTIKGEAFTSSKTTATACFPRWVCYSQKMKTHEAEMHS